MLAGDELLVGVVDGGGDWGELVVFVDQYGGGRVGGECGGGLFEVFVVE